MLSDMDQNGMLGIVSQSEEEPAKLKSSTKFFSFLIIHNFNVYFCYLNPKMLKNTFLMVKNSLQKRSIQPSTLPNITDWLSVVSTSKLNKF